MPKRTLASEGRERKGSTKRCPQGVKEGEPWGHEGNITLGKTQCHSREQKQCKDRFLSGQEGENIKFVYIQF